MGIRDEAWQSCCNVAVTLHRSSLYCNVVVHTASCPLVFTLFLSKEEWDFSQASSLESQCGKQVPLSRLCLWLNPPPWLVSEAPRLHFWVLWLIAKCSFLIPLFSFSFFFSEAHSSVAWSKNSLAFLEKPPTSWWVWLKSQHLQPHVLLLSDLIHTWMRMCL